MAVAIIALMSIRSINPATGETLKSFDELSEPQIDESLTRAANAFRNSRRTSLADRSSMMLRVAEILENEKNDYARLMTTEMGKPIKAAAQEAEKCAWVCRYYAETAEKHLADQIVETNATKSYVHFQPLGVVLAVMPWNFPFWQVFRFAAPALMAGNVGLLKHASNVPQCALAITDIFSRAGFPDGAFQTLLIGSEAVQDVLEDSRVAAATLTGSEPAGRSVASIAGKQIKKTVLELGGSDPFIVMPSADLKEAVGTAVKARTINNGQSCIAAKRFIVHGQIYDEFEKGFVEAMKALRVGDPMNESTDVGPLATMQILKDLEEQVQVSVAAGAKITGVTVSLAEGGASLRGRITSAREEQSLPLNLRLYLVPAEREASENVLRFFEVGLESDRTFTVANIAPGRYWVIARPAEENDSTRVKLIRQNSDFRARVLREAESLKKEVSFKPCERTVDYDLQF